MKTTKTMVSILSLGAFCVAVSASESAKATCSTTYYVTATTPNTPATSGAYCSYSSYQSLIEYSAEFSGDGENGYGYCVIDSFSTTGGNYGYANGVYTYCLGQGWVNSGFKGPCYSASDPACAVEVECEGSATEAEAYVWLYG